MKVTAYILGIVVCLVAATFLLTFEGTVALTLGWIVFLLQVLPRMTVNLPNLAVGLVALIAFAAGIHLMGRSWFRRRAPAQNNPVARWRIRWTSSILAAVIVLFSAGISMIGIVHQASWLLTSESPMLVPSLGGWDNSENQLRMIGMASLSVGATSGALPPGGTFAPNGNMLHSWETHLLPFVGYYVPGGIDMERPWNDPASQKYFKCVLPVFTNSGFRGAPLKDAEGYGFSHYAINSWVSAGNKSTKLVDIKDGASNTLLVGQVNSDFKPWGHPVNWRDPAIGLNRSPEGFGGTSGSGGVLFTMADGSVRFVSDRISPEVLKALSTPHGNKSIANEGWETVTPR
jgi:hypothetical protein